MTILSLHICNPLIALTESTCFIRFGNWRVLMEVSTSRFGSMQVGEEDILLFGEGILGFENLRKFFIVDPGDDTLIMWLQSIEDGAIAFPIIEPQVFRQGGYVNLLPSELKSLELEDASAATVYNILTIPKDITRMSANLKAPILINSSKNIARQIVLQDNKLSVCHEMYKELKAHIITMASISSRNAEGRREETTQKPIPANRPPRAEA